VLANAVFTQSGTGIPEYYLAGRDFAFVAFPGRRPVHLRNEGGIVPCQKRLDALPRGYEALRQICEWGLANHDEHANLIAFDGAELVGLVPDSLITGDGDPALLPDDL